MSPWSKLINRKIHRNQRGEKCQLLSLNGEGRRSLLLKQQDIHWLYAELTVWHID
jgi:hypothetical protein